MTRSPTRCLPVLFCATIVEIVLAASYGVADDRSDFFENRIRPLLIAKCAECHAGDTPQGNFRLDSEQSLRKGGAHGPVVIEGEPANSAFFQRLVTDAPEQQMPPEQRLSETEIADVKKWIEDGAVWPDSSAAWATDDDRKSHWAFQKVRDEVPPQTANDAWCTSPIDRFIAAQHERRGITAAPPADRRTLIRRATLDLTGLPPSIEDVRAFEADGSSDAFSRVIDRLLASRSYGERWGRHWLDQARYADTSGDGTDTPIPESRYYRNYVIDSFNNDLPYNQFLKEQIAGDLLARQNPEDPRASEQIIATGYIALSRRFGNSAYASMNLIIDDTIDTIGKSVLGLTLGCARCHHHKFDPVTTDDYYGLYGYFENTQYPHAGTEHQKERSHFVSMKKTDHWREDYDSLEAWAVTDKEKLSGDAHILVAGEAGKKGERVRRGYLSVVTSDFPDIPPDSSGRLQFAEWIAGDDNPLTARVIVNRVWQYHFGRGIVESSSNFGLQGARPDHPELLDWLTMNFIRQGWSLKQLHRTIMLSSVYQLSGEVTESGLRNDEANRSLWRFPRRRMDAETIRDSLLSVSRLLKDGDGGRHPFKPNAELKYSQGRPFNEIFDHKYRSVYLMTPRLNKHPFMALFDGPDPNKTTENRRESTVALQALFIMNSAFMKEVSAAFADRLITFSSDTRLRAQHAFETTLSRSPTEEEYLDIEGYLTTYRQQKMETDASETEAEADKRAWTSFSRALLGSNEFMYID